MIVRAVLAAVAVLIAGAALGYEAPEETTPVATIAKRVETLRGLRFDRLPKPERVDAKQARTDGLADLDTGYPAAQRHADETLYALLGLLPEGTDLREVNGSLFGQGVAGYYDPRSRRLKIVAGAGASNRVLDEMVVAHELDHALEDQAIGLDLNATLRSDDRGYAYKALVEGTATAIMIAYVGRYFDPELALGGLLGGSFAGTGTEGLPDFVVAGLTFPYLGGQRFVDTLRQRGGWALVDAAERLRPPTTTEEILHPEKWIAAEATVPVRTPAAPGPGWRRLTAGTFGEWQTGRLVRSAIAADGWGGDRYALYARGTARWLAMRWRMDTATDADELAAALRDHVAELPGARVTRAGGEIRLAVSRA